MGKDNTCEYAACRYCGQMCRVEDEELLTDEELVERATMECDCKDARNYQKNISYMQQIEKAIETEFGEDAGAYALPEEVREAMKILVVKISEERIKKAVIMLSGKRSIVISLSATGKLQLEKNYKDKIKTEV